MKLKGVIKKIQENNIVQVYGRIKKVIGLIVECEGIKAPIGCVCKILNPEEDKEILAEVVGFKNSSVLLMPYEDPRGIRSGSPVKKEQSLSFVPVGRSFLGRVVDSFGSPIDNKGTIKSEDFYPLFPPPINPLNRPRITEPLDVGIRAINGILTIGKGQRVGIMAGSGVGKSTLMGMIARYTKADVNVIALVGERGREVLEFIEKSLGKEGLDRSVVVVATSDQSPLMRIRAAYAATTMAEYFRDLGMDVLFMMDSVTRFAMALREVGLAAGEPPTTRGYTPSVFAQLPKLLERAGRTDKGSITGIYTVLVEGDDFTEPVADTVRSILDGHIVLTRELADQGHYPSIDILKSVSRLRNDVVPKDILTKADTVISLLATYKRVEDMINIGAYREGTSKEIDRAIKAYGLIIQYLRQGIEEKSPLEDSFKDLDKVLRTVHPFV